MIADKDRSYYIGASDTSFVVGNWETKSFERWFWTKQGIYTMDFSNEAMLTGTAYEHRILDSLKIPGLEKDRQIIIDRLRINLDGNTPDCIYEVKTYRLENGFKVPKKYKQQVCVQMYGTGIRRTYIVAYGLEEADYNNWYRDIDQTRISLHEIEYDSNFIDGIYLPRLGIITECLEKGTFPQGR